MSPKSWAGMENVRGKRRISFCFAVILLVPEVGLEPTLPEGNRILSPARLPFRHSGMRKRTTIILWNIISCVTC